MTGISLNPSAVAHTTALGMGPRKLVPPARVTPVRMASVHSSDTFGHLQRTEYKPGYEHFLSMRTRHFIGLTRKEKS